MSSPSVPFALYQKKKSKTNNIKNDNNNIVLFCKFVVVDLLVYVLNDNIWVGGRGLEDNEEEEEIQIQMYICFCDCTFFKLNCC